MELYGNSDSGSDSSASEVDVVAPLDSSQISYFTVQNNKATIPWAVRGHLYSVWSAAL
jgi:hypothetical protein